MKAAILLIVVTLLSSCERGHEAKPADIVILGPVYTSNLAQPWAEAVAVDDGSIVYVGDRGGVDRFQGEQTRVINASGKMVMPGIVDGHVHPLRGATKALYDCSFPFTATPEEVTKKVGECVTNQQEAPWIVGGQWDSGFFERFDVPSPRSLLDTVSPDKPVYLKDDSLHNAWVNSKALALGGFDADTIDPPGGRILREADGSPNGVLLETAAKKMNSLVPTYSHEQQVAAAAEFSRIANAYGITAAKSASTYEHEMAALQAADRVGDLTVHMAVSIRTADGARGAPLDYAAIEAKRDRYRSSHVHTDFVKIFLDGVPTPARTAAMLSPYLPDAASGESTDGGPLLVPMDPLAMDLQALDQRGFTVKMHAAGDRSVRIALDAIEAVREANGESGLRHELAHAGYVHPDDIHRFRTLDAVADLSPILWHPSPIIAAVISAVGETRGRQYWPVRDFIDQGAPLLAGSDWPAAVPDANPWIGIEALVTRRDPRGQTPGALWPEQKIDLTEALEIYTRQGARALRLEDRIGTIEVGKSADLIVLEHNLFEIAVDRIGDTRVLMTLFEGRVVHEQPW